MKIFIIGVSGSGKTYLAEKLSKDLSIPHYDLDDVQWDGDAGVYGVKRDREKRDMMLNKMLDQGEWIVEGVYYAWCKRCFEEADRIILLDVPPQVYKYRILKRYIRRKLKLEKGKKETWKSVRDLIRWADKYHKYDLVKIKKILDDHAEKVTILYNTKKTR